MPVVGCTEDDNKENRSRFLFLDKNASTKQARQIKMEMVEELNKKYDIDVDLFTEFGNNFTVGGASSNF